MMIECMTCTSQLIHKIRPKDHVVGRLVVIYEVFEVVFHKHSTRTECIQGTLLIFDYFVTSTMT